MAYNQIGQIGQRVGPEGSSIRSGWVRDAGGAWIFVGHATVPKDSFIAFEGRYLYGGTLYFTSSGTFSKADYPGLRAVRAKVQGAGGRGGSALTTGAGQRSAGAGAGGGGYAESFLLVGDLSDSETVAVGAGGASSPGGVGADGGNSSFGSHVIGEGGTGGSPASPWASGTPNHGAAPGVGGGGTGDLVVYGDDGFFVYLVTATMPRGGFGGGSFLSGSRRSSAGNNSSGSAGRFPGAGGSGAQLSENQSGIVGGDGADGIVIVELYY